jgi:uncharacterized Rossmann fold enzyme
MYIYDLKAAPASFDFLVWLAGCGVREQGPFDVTILKGLKDGFRDDNLEPQNTIDRMALLQNVMIPATQLFPVRNFNLFPSTAEGHRHIYTARALYWNERPVPSLKVPEWALRTVRGWYPKPPVVVSLRTAGYHTGRNANTGEWAKAIEAIRDKGHEVVVVKEFGAEKTFHNLILRAALHEHAFCVLGSSGGPMTLSYLNANATYCMFKPIGDDTASSAEWWESIGIPPGLDFPWAYPNQKIAWADDDADTIVAAFEALPKEKSGKDYFEPPRPKGRPRFIQGLNTPPEVMEQQAEENLKRDLPMFLETKAHTKKAIVVGGGPSLSESLTDIRKHKARGGKIFALNGVHDWLIERGIVPDYLVLLDARPQNVTFVQKPHKDVTYLVAAQCHPDVFEALKGYKVMMWVAVSPGMNEIAKKANKSVCVVGGGNTVGLKTLCLAWLWGYRNIHLFGFDSSYRDKDNHAYRQALNDGEAVMDITVEDGKTFKCARWMAKQALDFLNQLKELNERGVNVHVHGDGLIPHVAERYITKVKAQQQKEAA